MRVGTGCVLVSIYIVVALSASACMRPQPSPTEKLNTALHAFHGHLIFQRFDDAAGFMPRTTREEFMAYYEDQREDFHITEYEVTRLEITPDETTARAVVRLSWYRLPSTKVHTSELDEQWRFEEEAGRWEVVEQKVTESPQSVATKAP